MHYTELTLLKEIEQKHNVEVLYCSEVGSKLFGTNHSESDSDHRFIYKNSLEDILLGTDRDSIKIGEQTNIKNTKDDVDFDGWSVQHWFNLLKRGETNSLNLLFSMFKNDSILYQNEVFTSVIRDNYTKLLTKKTKSFQGYALSQAKRFGIKGVKYTELTRFKEFIMSFSTSKNDDTRVQEILESIKEELKVNNYKYIKVIMAPGPTGSGEANMDIEYISILDKWLSSYIKISTFQNKLSEMHGGYGNRTKSIANTESKTDFKALSHAAMISEICIELLTTNFIKFPIDNAKHILDIKYGNINVQDIVQEVEDNLETIDELIKTTTLPESVNTDFMNKVVLELYK